MGFDVGFDVGLDVVIEGDFLEVLGKLGAGSSQNYLTLISFLLGRSEYPICFISKRYLHFSGLFMM